MSWRTLRFIPRDTHTSRLGFAAGTLVLILLTALSARHFARTSAESGLHLAVHQRYAFDGRPVLERRSSGLSLAFLDEDASLPRVLFTARWDGCWLVDQERVAGIVAGADDHVIVTLDGRTVVDRNAVGDLNRTEPPAVLTAGWHRLSVFYEQFGGGHSLDVRVVDREGRLEPFSPTRLFPEEAAPGAVLLIDRADALRRVVNGLWVVLLFWCGVVFAPAAIRRLGRLFRDSLGPAGSESMRRWAVIPPAMAVIGGILLVAAADTGPDYGAYIDWTNAFLFRDIFLMRSQLASPLGVPMAQVSHGPGLILGLGRLMVGRSVSVDTGAMAIGGLAGVAFWWAMFRILSWAAEGRVMLARWAAAVMFLGTHAGFYSHHHASESIALALVAYLTLAVIEGSQRRDLRLADTVLVGAAAGLLVVTRAYLAPYAVPALALHAARIVSGRHGRSAFRTVAAACALVAPLGAAVLELGFANRWMTGSATTSPYVFGDATFRSMDWAHPEWLAVLVHPWHGLLVYHPLYAVAFPALAMTVVGVFRSPSPVWVRAVAVTALVSVLLHLYVQAAWYVWWMGTATFGSRGLATISVILMTALTRAIAHAYCRSPNRARLWVGTATVCAVWSYVMLLQGTSQFLSYSAVLAGQWGAVKAAVASPKLVGFAVLAVPFAVFAARLRQGHGDGQTDRWLSTLTALLGLLVFAYLFQVVLWKAWLAIAVVLFAAALLLIALWAVSTLVAGVGRGLSAGAAEPCLVRWGLGIGAVATTVLFVMFAIDTERRLAAGNLPSRRLGATTTFHVSEVVSSYNEYRRVPGFEDKKRALRLFLKLE